MAESNWDHLSSMVAFLGLLLIFLVGKKSETEALWLGECHDALGMESGVIPDSSITASSVHAQIVGPHNARVRVDNKGGAWCPRTQLNSDSREFLQVDFGAVHVITATETQGRFDNGVGQEYTEAYQLEYWRPGLQDFVVYRNGFGNQTLLGNKNTYLAHKNFLTPPLLASKIRFIPVMAQPRTVCLRVELYGCLNEGGLLSYSGEDGSVKDPGFLLKDDSYDGSLEYSKEGPNILRDGIGQLYDGELGKSLSKLQEYGYGKGWEWVGWPSEILKEKAVELIFAFENTRNFSAAAFYAFVDSDDGFTLPTSVEVYFGDDLRNFHSQPVKSTFTWGPNYQSETVNVTVDLNSRPAQILKVFLHFSGPWLVISEVYFESEPCNFSALSWRPNEASPPAERTADAAPVSASGSSARAYIGIVIGFLTALFILVAAGLFVYMRRLHKKRKSSPHVLKSPLTDAAAFMPCAGSAMYGLAEEDPYHEPYKTPLFSASSEYSIGRVFFPPSSSVSEYALPILSPPPAPFNTAASTPFSPTPLSTPGTPFPAAGTPHSASGTFRSVSLLANGFPSTLRLTAPPVPPPPEKYLTSPPVAKGIDITGPFGMSQYQLEGMNTVKLRNPREIQRISLHYDDKMGEGIFGSVYLGEVVGVGELLDAPGPAGSIGGRQVVVAALKEDVSIEIREETWRYARLLASLSDANLAELIGVISRDDPLVLVMECPPLGDLNQFLRRHVPDTTTPKLNHMRAISYGSLIYMASQIASGMKYLEGHNITHRDLATRNLMAGRNLHVKVGTVGSCRSLYAGDYYHRSADSPQLPEGTVSPLPIRWMSWEALFQGNFSNKSDVWAFGVTLWEILTLARQQPYERFSDEGVIENLAHFYHDDEDQTYLTQPASCPKEIYDLMLECWRYMAVDRPNFRDIYAFLQRKNQGYIPEE